MMSLLILLAFDLAVNAKTIKTSANIIVSVPSTSPAYIQNLRSGSWYKIPNSKMRSVVSTVGSGNVANVIEAWSGGAFDSKRNRLLIWGGGHNDYSGNEVYAFELVSQKWTRLTQPSAAPTSVHTYNHLEYLPKQDLFVGFGGATWPNGSTTDQTWMLNLTKNQWVQGPTMPGSPYSLYNFNMTSGYDPLSDRILVAGYAQSATFNGASLSWSLHGSADRSLYETGAFDTKRRIFFKFGGGRHSALSVDANGSIEDQFELATTGDKTIENCTNPGLQYSPRADRIVGWCSGGDIFIFNPDTLSWSRVTATLGTGPSWPAGYKGTFGRFRYVPDFDIFVVVTSIDDDVFVYKL